MKLTAVAWRVGFIVALMTFTALPLHAQQSAHVVTILHTNDIHGHVSSWQGWEGELKDKTVGGLARLAARVRQVRDSAGEQGVLLLDAGDTLGDTLLAAHTEGKAVMSVMNAMGYDAMVIGNHEPDFTAEKLQERIKEARFPILAANIVMRDSGELYTKPYIIRDINGLRVAILGLAYPNTPLTTARKNVKNIEFIEAAETARQYVPRLRAEGAQIIIALTHLGLGADKHLAENVEGIDVIVGGHSHNRMREALVVGDTIIVQAGAHGSDIGRLDLSVDPAGRISNYEYALLPVTDAPNADIVEDKQVKNIIAPQRAPLRSTLQERVGRAQQPIIRAQTINGGEAGKRDQESPADSLFADIIRAITRTDVAFLPGVGYGVAIQPGFITAEMLRNLLPHDSAVWTMRLMGKQIRDTLEQSVDNFSTNDPTKKVGGMIQISGLHFSYDPRRPRNERVREIIIADKPIENGKDYLVATNALLAEGGHNYRAFTQGMERREVGKQYEMIKEWIMQQDGVSTPPLGRITNSAEEEG